MIAIVFTDVIACYCFDSGSIAMQEMEWHLFAAVFLLGAAYTMREMPMYEWMYFTPKCLRAERPSLIFWVPCFLSFPCAPDFIQGLRSRDLFLSNTGNIQ